MKRPTLTRRSASTTPESGQAVVEFALILLPLMIIVVGIIQFGIALNYWLDLNRLSNQGARWAVVNAYPDCGLPSTDNDPNTISCGGTTSLQQYIACGRLPGALRPTVSISFPNGSSDVGNPVRVTISTPYTFRAIVKLGTITLSARTEMRLEQEPGRYTAGTYNGASCP